MSVAGIVSGLIAAGSVIGPMLSNADANKTNKKIADTNNYFQQENFNRQFDYTKQMQHEAWRRDDTMFQRGVNDATNAGFSPLAVLGNTPSNSNVVSTPSAPHYNSPQMQGIMSGVNMDGLIDKIIASEKLKLEDKGLEIQKEKNLTDADIRRTDIKTTATTAANQLRATNENIKAQITSNEKIAGNKLNQQVAEFNANLSYLVESRTFNQKMEYQKYMLSNINSMLEEARGKSGGYSSNYRTYSDKVKYEEAMVAFTNRYSEWASINLSKPSTQSRSQSSSAGGSAGVNLGLGNNESSYQGGSYGQHGNAGANMSLNGAQSTSEYVDYSLIDKQKLVDFFNKNPIPLYRPEIKTYDWYLH